MTRADPDRTRIEWHRDDADQEVIVGVDGGEVRAAVALPPDAPLSTLDAVLAALERELDHLVRRTG